MRTNKTKTNKEQDTRKNIILELKDKNKKKENKTKNFTYLYFIVVLIVLGLLNGYFFAKGEMKTIQYSEFKELMAKGKIADISIDKETIQGELTLEDGKKVKFLTVKVEDPDLIKDLQKNSIKYAGRSENKIVSTIISWVLPLALMFLIWNLLMRKMGGAPSGILSFGKSRGKIYGEDEIKITFEDAAGVDEAKEELKEIIEYLRYPQKFLDIGGKIPKGILLVGPPGTGKTLLAKAVAGEAKVPFFSLSGSDFVEMFVGVGASRVRDLFSQAQEKSPVSFSLTNLMP
jgi:cell division protease FtsH